MNANFSAIAGAVASFAPTLASMLGGPLAGTAVAALESALGLGPAKTPGESADAVAAALKAQTLTAEQITAIKLADNEHQEKMKALDIDLSKLNADTAAHMLDTDAGDRGSARLRESTVHDNTPKILAYVVTLLVILAEGSMFFVGQPQGIDGVVLGRILGTLDSALIMVLTYYFGSSSGAARGQELLAQSGPAPNNAAPIEVTSK